MYNKIKIKYNRINNDYIQIKDDKNFYFIFLYKKANNSIK